MWLGLSESSEPTMPVRKDPVGLRVQQLIQYSHRGKGARLEVAGDTFNRTLSGYRGTDCRLSASLMVEVPLWVSH